MTVPDETIFENVLWVIEHCKLVAEGAAAATVAAVRSAWCSTWTRVVCVLSGGNLDLAQLRGLHWSFGALGPHRAAGRRGAILSTANAGRRSSPR